MNAHTSLPGDCVGITVSGYDLGTLAFGYIGYELSIIYALCVGEVRFMRVVLLVLLVLFVLF